MRDVLHGMVQRAYKCSCTGMPPGAETGANLRAPRLAQAQAEKQPSVSVPLPQVGFQNMHMCSREVRDLKECCRKYNEVGCQGRKT